jgi:hypothetical protein
LPTGFPAVPDSDLSGSPDELRSHPSSTRVAFFAINAIKTGWKFHPPSLLAISQKSLKRYDR